MKKSVYEKFMKDSLNTWYHLFEPRIFDKDIIEIFKFLKSNNLKTYPEAKKMFNAFKYCDYKNLKLVIISDKPVKDSFSDGLAFSSSDTNLKTRIFNKNENFKYLINQPNNDVFYSLFESSFIHVAKQGVLFLNLQLLEFDKPLKENIFKPFIDYLFFNILCNNNGLITLRFNDDCVNYINNKFFINFKTNLDILNAKEKVLVQKDNVIININKVIEKQNGKEFIIKW
jgi:hypothetical protein